MQISFFFLDSLIACSVPNDTDVPYISRIYNLLDTGANT
jgi:hypothetical protein